MVDISPCAYRPPPIPTRVHALETPLHQPPMVLALGPEESLDDPGVSFRHSGWVDRRESVSAAQKIAGLSFRRQIRFEFCGSTAWVMRSVEEPIMYRVACDKCKDRFCVPCSIERARHVARRVGTFAEGRDLRLVTLTLAQSNRSLKQDLDRLYSAFTKLRRRATWRQTQSGGVAFVEIKRRRSDDGWHTHMHVLTEGRWLSKSWLSAAWNSITGDSYIVDIRQCKSGSDAASYVAKYASKGVHGSVYHSPELLAEAILAVKGRRLVAKFGTWRSLDLGYDSDSDDWVPVDSLSRLLRRMRNGDREACAIIRILYGDKLCLVQTRSPPIPGT